MIVCSDCMQPVGLHKDTSQYYHLPPMKDHCDVSYVFALDIGKTGKTAIKVMKELAEENLQLKKRIDRALTYVNNKDIKSAVAALEDDEEFDV